MQLERWAGARRVRRGMRHDVLFVIAQYQPPAAFALHVQNELQAFRRTRPAIDRVAGHNHPIRLPALDPLQRPAFDDKPGEVPGLLVGVGEHQLAPGFEAA